MYISLSCASRFVYMKMYKILVWQYFYLGWHWIGVERVNFSFFIKGNIEPLVNISYTDIAFGKTFSKVWIYIILIIDSHLSLCWYFVIILIWRFRSYRFSIISDAGTTSSLEASGVNTAKLEEITYIFLKWQNLIRVNFAAIFNIYLLQTLLSVITFSLVMPKQS